MSNLKHYSPSSKFPPGLSEKDLQSIQAMLSLLPLSFVAAVDEPELETPTEIELPDIRF